MICNPRYSLKPIINCCQWLLFYLAAAPFILAINSSDELAWQQVAKQCINFEYTVQTLESYQKFQENYDKLNECLHRKNPPAICLAAEQSCRQNELLYTGVKILGQLVKRAANGELVCHIEFASKIYRLHKQVADNGASPKLARHLRSLANRWASRCRKSIAQRLYDIEQRAPAAYKHVNLIVNILNIGMEKVSELKVEPEHYVPVLADERVLDERISSAGAQAASGFHFNTSKQIDAAIPLIKKSCQTLKLYHINTLGAMGLLASVGYAAPRSLDKDRELVRSTVRRWLVSALLCQMLRGVTRMSSTDSEGNDFEEILVLPLQEADVSEEAEHDNTFATFGLPEAAGGRLEMDIGGFTPVDLHVYNEFGRLNNRKMELINGPSRTLATAIYTYLDLRQKERMPMATTILELE